MMFLYTTSDKLAARAIRYYTREPASHFAVLFDEGYGRKGLVFHATVEKVKPILFKDFLAIGNRVVAAQGFKYSDDLDLQENVYTRLLSRYDGKEYDFGAFLYHMVNGTAKRLGIKTSDKNLWGSSKRALCTELGQEIYQALKAKGFTFHTTPPEDFEMITPWHLREVLAGCSGLYNATNHLRGMIEA